MMTEHLLEQFPPVSTAAWEATIARDLKGADYGKKLIWRTEDGLAAKPYYRADDLKGLACLDAAPGEFPYRRGTRMTGAWQVREQIDATDADEANRAARAAVAAGAEAISFGKALPQSSAELDVLLAGLGEIPVHLEYADERLILLLRGRFATQREASVSSGYDALKNADFAAEIIQEMPSGFVPFTIHADTFEESGATAVEEVGFALAAGLDFLAAMQERGIDADRAAAAIEFSFAMGANYFFQIAKLRAFRMLWAGVTEKFGATSEGARARIAARTSRWDQSIYDPHVNILRSTTEAMAAVLGGADAVTVEPFDECYKKPDEASRRLARNTQLLLKHEAFLGQVADPGGGSYYLESITDLLAREAWKKMQEIELRGGYRAAQAGGFIAHALVQSLAARDAGVARRRRLFIGTNQFANPAERALEQVDENRMTETVRGARRYEELRLRTERCLATGGKEPRVLLAEIGDIKMRAARATFAMNFFACAGLATATKRFKKAEEIAGAEGDLIVLCSSDAEYGPIVAELMPKMKMQGRSTPVIVAGNPKNAVELAAAGVADFVHVRSNPVEMLAKWQEWVGIKD
jgi:methylmalonyl-CoA mutase